MLNKAFCINLNRYSRQVISKIHKNCIVVSPSTKALINNNYFKNLVSDKTHDQINLENNSFTLFSNLGTEKNDAVSFLIKSMDVMRGCEGISKIKENAIQAIITDQENANYLEAGCGTGEDAEYIAELVSRYNGNVVAIDNSPLMLNIAKNRSKEKNIIYDISNVYELPYTNEYFNGIHADRLLVSSKNPKMIINEMVRVLKPGGKIAVTDVDAKSIVISPYNKTTQIFIDQALDDFRNATIGRDLLGMFKRNGLEDLKVEVEISTIRSLDTFEKIFMVNDVLSKAINSGKLTKDESTKWYDCLKQADSDGKFLYAIMFFTAVGCKPKSFDNIIDDWD